MILNTLQTWRKTIRIQKKFLPVLLAIFSGFLLSPDTEARESISMYVGEVQVMAMGEIERVAIGNPAVASNTILPQGQLVFLADAVGVTTMHIWLKDGSEKNFDVTVREKQVLDSHLELVHLLADIPGIKVTKNGDSSVIRGNISFQDKIRYDRILARYPNVLDLVTARDTTADLSQLLSDIPGLTVREIGGYSVLSGEVSDEYGKVINIVEGKYPNILNLTRVQAAVAGKMVYMKVQIMEIDKKITEQLGINWNILKGIPGPSFEFGLETDRQNSSILNSSQFAVPGSLTKSGQTNLTTATGYFGIATGISSVINLYEGTGDAVILAEPRLSTRSGGSAEFLAGGEYPVPTSNSLGATNVEFKKYGITLNVAPVVDDQNNILAHIETEISQIDDGTKIGEIPGVLTRRTNTDVSLRAEETLVIAGLVQDLASKNYDNVKWLSDLPVLGPLFKSKNFKNQQTELVIFITPYIYDASSPLNIENLAKGEAIRKHLNEIIDGESLLE
jgi:pilus assembly protein CpaC